MRLFLDTNIIIDVLSNREGCANSLQVLRFCETQKVNGTISAISISDIMYIMRKHSSQKQLRDAMQTILTFLELVGVTPGDITGAFACDMEDYEDAVQAQCASRTGAEYIITRNIKDYLDSPVQARTPEEILPQLRVL